jgi:hypothetical protein
MRGRPCVLIEQRIWKMPPVPMQSMQLNGKGDTPRTDG